MSTIATAQFGSDDDDGDFAPALKDLHGADANSSGSESEDSEGNPRPRKKKRKLAVEEVKPVEPVITKEAIDDLWASFNDPVDVLVAQEDKKPVKLVTIQKQFQFAGDVILQDVEVPEDSEEAIAYRANPPEASTFHAPEPSTSTLPAPAPTDGRPAKRPPPTRKKGGLAAMQAQLASKAKPKKLTTLEKSKFDWDSHVQAEGLKEDLDSARKSQMSYLEKQDFLARAEGVREEAYRKLKAGSRRAPAP